MTLSTYPHRFLSDREVNKLLGWIPIHLIQLLGKDKALEWMKNVILPMSRGETITELAIAGSPELPPLVMFSTSAAIHAAVDYHTNAERVGPSADKDNPVEAAFQWNLDNWEATVYYAQDLNKQLHQQLGQEENGTEKKNQDN